MARVNNRETLGILLDITFLILIVCMIVFLFNKANELAREEKTL